VKPDSDQGLAGILEPVFAIRTENDLGIGDTEGVRQMIDWCHKHGLNIFQTLPINETDGDNSPYNAISSVAIDPGTIAVSPRSIPDLSGKEFERLAPAKLLRDLRAADVNYTKVKALKRALLEAAFENFAKDELDKNRFRGHEFRRFLAEEAEWLPDYALFRLLMEENSGGSAWERWPAAQQTPQGARAWLLSLPEKERSRLVRKQLFFAYVQWLAFDQWHALKRYGEQKKVFLMGDIPFGVGRHSADVWANRAIFDMDWSGGAPPEMFFKENPFAAKWGQNWGIANYCWEEMRRRKFDWWRRRVDNIRKSFHFFRIDHAPGFFRIYSFPWTPDRNDEFLKLDEKQAAARTGGKLPRFRPYPDDTPLHKAANQAQGEEILRAVIEAAGDATVVAEDLGVVPEYARTVLHKLGIPGFRIPCFFREHDGRYSKPSHYPRLSLAQPATHDHPPLAAAWADFWRKIDRDDHPEETLREMRHLMEFAGVRDGKPPREFTDRLHEGYLRAILNSKSWLVVVMITDVFKDVLRFNSPGTVSNDNWSVRRSKTVKQLDEDPILLERTKLFSKLAKEAGRTGN
jgi:4-alpha-glucanotransferase